MGKEEKRKAGGGNSAKNTQRKRNGKGWPLGGKSSEKI